MLARSCSQGSCRQVVNERLFLLAELIFSTQGSKIGTWTFLRTNTKTKQILDFASGGHQIKVYLVKSYYLGYLAS